MLIDLIMKINVGDNQTIKEIQTNFSERYPYLKIEFFTKPHEKFRGSSRENMVDSNTLIKNCRSVHGEGEIEIFPSTKVSTVENKFREILDFTFRCSENPEMYGLKLLLPMTGLLKNKTMKLSLSLRTSKGTKSPIPFNYNLMKH